MKSLQRLWLWRLVFLFSVLGLTASATAGARQLRTPRRLAGPFGNLLAQVATPDPARPTLSGPMVGEAIAPVSLDVDLRTLPATVTRKDIARPELYLRPEGKESGPEGDLEPDAALQTQAPRVPMPSALQSFDGLNYANNGSGWPPDTNGDVGPNHYIQTVNTSIGIFNKSTGALITAFTFDAFFSGTNTACDNDNNGDPVALYDPLADRWLLSDFAWTGAALDTGPYYECIAVSKTSDPVNGGWWMYALRADDNSHPWLADYPKLGVWPDAYYMTANMFDCASGCGGASTFEGIRVWALDRSAMLVGGTLREVHFDISASVYDEVILPANLRGTPPPAGSPNYLVAMDDGFLGTDVLHLWKFHVDWNSPSNSTLSGPTDRPTASFSPFSSDLPQAGTTLKLDSLGDRLMMQLQYRYINGVESLWLNHTVNTSSNTAGIRWYEIRNPNTTPVIYQQGTYGPADGAHRWMGSLAVDHNGNMALGYSASSSASFPAIRYAGRLTTDSLNTLGQGETELIAGGGAHSSPNGCRNSVCRWGDYSAMTVDPTDDCTFWFTTEYYATSGSAWRTRIGAFKFPTCAIVQQGTLNGTVVNASAQALSNVLIQAVSVSDTLTTTTKVNGTYSLTLPSGVYVVTAAAYGYLPTNVNNVTIASNALVAQNFSLSPAVSYTVSGAATDSALGWPLSATVTVSGALVNPPVTAIRTNAQTGAYTLTLAGGQAYTLTASALLHADLAQNTGMLSSDQTRNFALVANASIGGVLGYVTDYTTSLPIANARVTASGLSAATDAQGFFQLAGLPPGVYTVTASANLHSAVSVTNVQIFAGNFTPLTFTLPTPVFSYSASVLSRTVALRTQVTDPAAIVITNTGLGELSYEIFETTGSAPPDGYTLRASTGPSGFAYAWQDASPGATLVLSDDGMIPITLPFAFPFYTSTATTLWVNNNGFAFLGTPTNNLYFTNTDLTINSTPNNLLAPFWDDLTADTGGVYWTVTGVAPERVVVVEWSDRPHFTGSAPTPSGVTVELVLFEDGDLLYQYQDVDFGDANYSGGNSATVGMRGVTVTQVSQYSFNSTSLQNNFALCWDANVSLRACGQKLDGIPWLNVTPVSASLPGGLTNTLGLSVTWDTSAPPATWLGVYTGTLQLSTNDLQQPSATFPVTLTVPVGYGVYATPVYTAYADPGATTTYTVRVFNYGNVTDTFSVTVSNTVSVVGPLGAGQSAVVTVPVTVPPGTPLGDIVPTLITFASQSAVSQTATTTLATVSGFLKVFMPLIATPPSGPTATRAEALVFYQQKYLAVANTPVGWTGAHAACNPGATSPAFRAAVLQHINYFRELAGLPTAILSDTYNSSAQTAALMMSVNKDLNHTPPNTWACYSAAGAQAAGKSNLFLGVMGWDAVDGYILEGGFLGHRRWILYPQTQAFGTGDVPNVGDYPSSNVLWVFDNNIYGARPKTKHDFVAWPPPGYVPHPVVNDYWSFSYPQADFSNAAVTMTANNVVLPVTLGQLVNGYGENTLIWLPAGVNGMWPAPTADTVYSVQIQNVVISNQPRNFTYDVVIFNPGP